MAEPTLVVATPLGGHNPHLAWSASMLKFASAFRGRFAISTQIGSLLPRNRDVLTYSFLQSGSSHMLCVDSDIGFKPEDVQALLDTGKDFVGGTYCKKQEDRAIPAGITGRVERGVLFQSEWVPAGFLLVSRAAIQRMFGAYRHLDYECDPWGRICGLWSPRPEAPMSGEDVSFCKRWRDLGQDVWLHRGVMVGLWDGGGEYLPKPDSSIKIVGDGPARDVVAAVPGCGHNHGAPEPATAPVVVPTFSGATIKMHGDLPVHVYGAAA